MSRATVHELLEQIHQLPVEDRHTLEELLAEEAEAEWRQQAVEARRTARAQGIDQEAIDQAIHAMRYGE